MSDGGGRTKRNTSSSAADASKRMKKPPTAAQTRSAGPKRATRASTGAPIALTTKGSLYRAHKDTGASSDEADGHRAPAQSAMTREAVCSIHPPASIGLPGSHSRYERGPASATAPRAEPAGAAICTGASDVHEERDGSITTIVAQIGKRKKRKTGPAETALVQGEDTEGPPVVPRRRRGRKGRSIYRGVCVTREGKWRAVIYKERKQLYLGVYESELEAAKAHDRAARYHFPDKAMCNFNSEAEADARLAVERDQTERLKRARVEVDRDLAPLRRISAKGSSGRGPTSSESRPGRRAWENVGQRGTSGNGKLPSSPNWQEDASSGPSRQRCVVGKRVPAGDDDPRLRNTSIASRTAGLTRTAFDRGPNNAYGGEKSRAGQEHEDDYGEDLDEDEDEDAIIDGQPSRAMLRKEVEGWRRAAAASGGNMNPARSRMVVGRGRGSRGGRRGVRGSNWGNGFNEEEDIHEDYHQWRSNGGGANRRHWQGQSYGREGNEDRSLGQDRWRYHDETVLQGTGSWYAGIKKDPERGNEEGDGHGDGKDEDRWRRHEDGRASSSRLSEEADYIEPPKVDGCSRAWRNERNQGYAGGVQSRDDRDWNDVQHEDKHGDFHDVRPAFAKRAVDTSAKKFRAAGVEHRAGRREEHVFGAPGDGAGEPANDHYRPEENASQEWRRKRGWGEQSGSAMGEGDFAARGSAAGAVPVGERSSARYEDEFHDPRTRSAAMQGSIVEGSDRSPVSGYSPKRNVSANRAARGTPELKEESHTEGDAARYSHASDIERSPGSNRHHRAVPGSRIPPQKMSVGQVGARGMSHQLALGEDASRTWRGAREFETRSGDDKMGPDSQREAPPLPGHGSTYQSGTPDMPHDDGGWTSRHDGSPRAAGFSDSGERSGDLRAGHESHAIRRREIAVADMDVTDTSSNRRGEHSKIPSRVHDDDVSSIQDRVSQIVKNSGP